MLGYLHFVWGLCILNISMGVRGVGYAANREQTTNACIKL